MSDEQAGGGDRSSISSGGGGGGGSGCGGGSGGGGGVGGGDSGVKRSAAGGAGVAATPITPIALAVASICSHDAGERDEGIRSLVDIADSAVRETTSRHCDGVDAVQIVRLKFCDAVVAAGGVRPIVRALRETFASPCYDTDCHKNLAFLVGTLAVGSDAICRSVAAAGCIAPLISLLTSRLDEVQRHAAAALHSLSCDAVTRAMVVAAGGVPSLQALLASNDKDVRNVAASALSCVQLPSSTGRATGANSWGRVAAPRSEVAAAAELLSSHRVGERATGIAALRHLSSLDDFEDALITAGGIVPLVRVMSVPHSDSGVHAGAASVVKSLAAGSLITCRALVAAGCIPPLVALASSSAVGAQVCEDAAAALFTLIDDDDDAAGAIAVAEAGGIAPLVKQLESRTLFPRVVAALHRLSTSDASAVAIAAAGGIPMLLALMGAREVASPDAAATLFNVSVVPVNRGAIVAAGGILALVHVLKSPVIAVHYHVIAILRILADRADACTSIAFAGGIRPLVALLQAPRVDELSNALGTLVAMSATESICDSLAAAHASPAATALLKPSCLPGIRALSSKLLFVLAGSTTAECAKGAISAISATRCAPLIELLKDDAPEYRAAGCRALRALASDRAARAAVVGAGVAALASLLSETADPAVSKCITAAVAALQPK
jgi:hypothetical protein